MSIKWSHLSGPDEYSCRIQMIRNAKIFPVFECLIDSGWRERGLAQILLSRRQPNGNLVIGIYLVDIFCLGLKNTVCNADISLPEYRKMKERMFPDSTLIPIPPGNARRIIRGAIEYARRWDFKPQEDFELSRFMLEGLPEPDNDFTAEFGRNGKPLYIAGPDDDFEAIIGTLTRTAGKGNYDFIAPLKTGDFDEGVNSTERCEKRASSFSKSHPKLVAHIRKAIDKYQKSKRLSAGRGEYELALQFRNAIESRPDEILEIDDEMEYGLLDWLLELPFELAGNGLVTEAAEIGKRFAEVFEPENFLADRAAILAVHGRRDEAATQVEEILARFPEDPWVAIKAGDACYALGDKQAAESLYRRGWTQAGDDSYTREGALERLIPLLEVAGRHDEAQALIAEQKKRHAASLQGDTMDKDSPLLEEKESPRRPPVRSSPKVGRNDPCPCGSGKKYKKCCLNIPLFRM